MIKFFKRLFGLQETQISTQVHCANEPISDGQALARLASIDLKPITENYKRRHRVYGNINYLVEDYRRFLFLVITNPGKDIVPWTQQLDDYWHEHILDTRKYNADCIKLWGKVIHHNPDVPKGSQAHTNCSNFTKEQYVKKFSPTIRNKDNREEYWLVDTSSYITFDSTFRSDNEVESIIQNGSVAESYQNQSIDVVDTDSAASEFNVAHVNHDTTDRYHSNHDSYTNKTNHDSGHSSSNHNSYSHSINYHNCDSHFNHSSSYDSGHSSHGSSCSSSHCSSCGGD